MVALFEVKGAVFHLNHPDVLHFGVAGLVVLLHTGRDAIAHTGAAAQTEGITELYAVQRRLRLNCRLYAVVLRDFLLDPLQDLPEFLRRQPLVMRLQKRAQAHAGFKITQRFQNPGRRGQGRHGPHAGLQKVPPPEAVVGLFCGTAWRGAFRGFENVLEGVHERKSILLPVQGCRSAIEWAADRASRRGSADCGDRGTRCTRSFFVVRRCRPNSRSDGHAPRSSNRGTSRRGTSRKVESIGRSEFRCRRDSGRRRCSRDCDNGGSADRGHA